MLCSPTQSYPYAGLWPKALSSAIMSFRRLCVARPATPHAGSVDRLVIDRFVSMPVWMETIAWPVRARAHVRALFVNGFAQ